MQADETAEPCPHGRTDYAACFAPFRYCPVKGCGRSEAKPVPCCGDAWCTCCQATGEHEHVAPRAWRLTEAAQATSGPWSKGIISQTLGEPVLAELRDNPIGPDALDDHSRWREHKIHRVVWRHAFTDHDLYVGNIYVQVRMPDGTFTRAEVRYDADHSVEVHDV